jgi:hypothetical protein
MPNYAIYKDNVILNVIVADSKEIAEKVTKYNAIETEGNPWIGWTLIDGVWTEPVQPEVEVIEEEVAIDE